MSSKTFKSAKSDNLELEIDYILRKPRLLVKDFDGDNKGFITNKSDAPALALAVLEAAGYSEESAGLMEYVVGNLREHVKRQELFAAEAKEQAELEAEALELCNAYRASFLHCAPEDGFEGFDDPEAIKAKWLAVARRAREMKRV